MGTNAKRVGLQLFFGYHIEDGQADGARDGIAAEGVEVFHTIVEGGRDLGCGHNSREWMAIANRLAQGHDVRHDSLCLKPPEMSADAPKTDLHLVGNTDTARDSYISIRFLEVIFGQDNLAAAPRKRLADKGRNPLLALLNVPDSFADIIGVELACQ